MNAINNYATTNKILCFLPGADLSSNGVIKSSGNKL